MIALALALLLASGADAGVAAAKKKVTRPACPAARSDVKPGARCGRTQPDTCQYGKSWCACELTSCDTAAGPNPDCVPKAVWVCRDDGCPRNPRGACGTEGQECAYDDGLCARQLKCSSGKWSSVGPPNCRPAAPPGPSY